MILFRSRIFLLKFIIFFFICFWLFPTGWSSFAEASNWRVAPIRLNLDAKSFSDVITVTNEGDKELVIEVSGMQWTQDNTGENIYRKATDLIYFPKQLTIEPNKERVIRVGTKVPAVNKEKTYRLFIKEIPSQNKETPNTVTIAFQFGVPIFIKPFKEEISGKISNITIEDSILFFNVENQGNSHFRVKNILITGLSSTGKTLFNRELKGWSLLAGASRKVSTEFPNETCSNTENLIIKIFSDQIELDRQIDVDIKSCSAS